MTTGRILTVGHSSRSIEEFLGLLRDADVGEVVDVRRLPGSRTYPWYDQDELSATLRDNGIGYRHIVELTGRRPKQPDVPDEVNGMWDNRSFHNYADWALGHEFATGLEEVIGLAPQRPAIMCSEAVWWRCHRRIIADHLVAHGQPVSHIIGPGKVVEATLMPGATVENGVVTYPRR